MTKSKQVKASLSAEQKQFLKHKTISDTRKIKNWIMFLSKLSTLDKLEDRRRAFLKRIIIGSFVVAVIFFLVAVIFEDPYYLIPSGLLAGFGALLLFIRQESALHDLNNYLRLFFMPVLHVLVDKAGREAKLSANLDFRDGRVAMPHRSNLIGRAQEMYAPTFIVAKTKLLDGVKLHFAMQDEIRDLKWSKTNPRGKVKSKSKTKTIHHLLIKMSFPKTKYKWNGETTEGLVIKKHRDHYAAKKKVKVKKAGEHLLPVKYFFNAIQSVYYQFEPTNRDETPSNSDVISMEGEDTEDLAPYIWQGDYFDDYDYDLVDYQKGSDLPYDQDEATIFDS